MSLLLKLKERFSNEQVETNNVIKDHPEIAQKLAAELEKVKNQK